VIGVNDVERLRIDTSGQVGIGTSNPSSALDVSGALTAEGMSSAPAVSAANTGRIYFDYSAGKFKVSQNGGAYADMLPTGAFIANGGNSTGADISIGTNDNKAFAFKANNTTAMTISQGGKIGIGTAPTGNAVTVNGTTYSTSFISENGGFRVNSGSAGYGAITAYSNVGNAGRLAFASGQAGWSWDAYLARSNANELTLSSDGSTGAATLNVRGSTYMATTSGNVAIGATSAGAKLDVTDASTTTSAIIVPRAGNFTGTTANGMIRYNTTSTLFEFYQNGAWVNYTTVSDGRLKTNVIPVTDGLGIVNQLHPVFYDWDRSNPKASGFEDKHQVGFIAQEVEKVLPEVVNKGEDSYRSLEYGKIVSVVVAAVKELYNKVLGIDRELASVKAQAASKIEVDQLKVENAQLKAKDQVKDKKINHLEQENAEMKARLDKIEKMLNSK
jgi:hypothetical protein